jgi:hypothetical protein
MYGLKYLEIRLIEESVVASYKEIPCFNSEYVSFTKVITMFKDIFYKDRKNFWNNRL